MTLLIPFKMLYDLIKQNRTYRRFEQDKKISENELKELIDLARLTPSPRNRQSLKFIISNTDEVNDKIFPTLSWAGALAGWNKPEEGEEPSAYVIILGDNSILPKVKNAYHNVASGFVAQSILLGAAEKGYGGCTIAAIQRQKLRAKLNIPEHLEILLVLALGVPKETVVIEKMPKNGNYDYWRDENNIHHVPKRSLNEILINYCK
ncbi:MAG: nitroreductase family protein [Bacteroidales bacterium]|nr:nitroreductase family protein [Bacteroidales bacterium]